MPAPTTQEARPPRKRRRDPFGYSPRFFERMKPFGEFLYRRYWRVTCDGITNVPAKGPVLIIGNHSGAIPLDGAMIAMALELDHPHPRRLRFLYDRFVADMPFMGEFYDRLGAVVASYDNARKLLQRREAVGIFPEGVEGVAKGIRQRYEVQRFRSGFVRLSLELRVPIVPVAVVGAEETYPVIGKWKAAGLFAKMLNVPYVPVTPFFPLFGVLGMVPLPTRWHIRFGPPLRFDHARTGAAPPRRVINELTEGVRRQIQGMVHALLAERDSVF